MSRARDIADQQDNLGGAVAPYVAGKNALINGGFDIWQRGTSITGASKRYTADRWSIYAGSGGSQSSSYTLTRQSTSDTTNLPFIQYCARFQRNSGSTSAQGFYFAQSFETVNSIPLAGQAVTISFYARKGANYSPTSSLLNIQVTSDTGTDQYFSDYSVYNDAISESATLTTTWQRFSYSGTFATNANEIAVMFNATPTGTAGANDYFEVTGVQLELGSQATPFARAGGSIGGELALCQRYYWRMATGAANPLGNGSAYSSSHVQLIVQFPVTMRVGPALDMGTGTDYFTFVRNGGSDTFNSFIIDSPSTIATNIYNNTQISSTAGNGGVIFTNNASAYLGFTSEL
jgi:hypothetical protein